ncbi:MAG: SRPBCC family protein [Rhodomicrobium sp.]
MQQARTGESTIRNETIVERSADRELVVIRTFNAPVHIVFDAWTKPELLKRWWAPKSFGVSLFECESDLRVGGAYRYAFGRDPKHPEVFSGRYVEVNSPSRLVLTQVYERMSDAGEAVVTATFEESQGRTRLTLHQLFPSKEALEGALASGMELGMRVTLDQLDALVASMR